MPSILQNSNLIRFLETLPLSASAPPIAVFDCDGTVVKGDVGEAMLYYQIEHFLFRQSPAEIWTDHPERTRLGGYFEALARVPAGDVQTQPAFAPFADMILDWYFGQIDGGKVAKACADIVRLLAGFTPRETRTMASQSFLRELESPPGERTLGRRSLPRGARYIKESVELLQELQRRGFSIWALSGSNKWSVEPVFARLSVPPEHVIGLEVHTVAGTLTSTEIHPVPVRKGKVDAMRLAIPYPPVLTASDSRNDIPMLLMSTGMKVRINSRGRSKEDFFNDVGSPPDASWINIEEPTVLLDGKV